MNANKKQQQQSPALVSASEEAQIRRVVLGTLNGSGKLPVGAIRYEQLDEGVSGMSMHVEQGAYKVKEYITGGYRAQLRFSLWYRIQPGDSSDERLRADEALDDLGEWACKLENLPELGGTLRAVQIVTNERAGAKGVWDNGDEDHRILLTLTYENI